MTRTRSLTRSVPGWRRLSEDPLFHRVGTGISWTLTGTISARLVALAATLAAARVLGAGSFGSLALVQSTIATFGVASGLGLGLAITRFVAVRLETERARTGSFIVSALSLCALSGFLVMLAALAYAHPFAAHVLGRPALASLLRVGAPILFIGPLADALVASLSGLQRFRSLASVQFTRGALDGVGIILGAATFGTTGAMVGFVVAETGALVVAGWLVFAAARALDIRLPISLDRSDLRQLLGFGLPALTASLAIQCSLWLSQVLLAHQAHGLELVGLFAIASRWYLAILFVPQTLEPVLLPVLGSLKAARSDAEFVRLCKSYALVDVGLVVPVAGAIALLAPVLLGLQGHTYAQFDSRRVLEILVAAAIPTVLNNVLGQVAIAMGRFAWWIISDFVLGLTVLGSAWALIPSKGATGLSIAYLIGYTATSLAILPAFLPISRRPDPAPIETSARTDPIELTVAHSQGWPAP